MDVTTGLAMLRDNTAPLLEVPSPPSRTDRPLSVTAVYCLSEPGRKASLLSGGDGRAVQQRIVEVPRNRLHLVSVDADGVARLRLRPHYVSDAHQQIVRI